jgi:hypothetical protein
VDIGVSLPKIEATGRYHFGLPKDAFIKLF